MAAEVDPPEQQAIEALREAARQLMSEGSYPQCDNGPDCECPFHIEALIAARTGWRSGHCTGCGMTDEPVKGPPGAQLCRWCDELRILAPLQPKVTETRRDPLLAHVHWRVLCLPLWALVVFGITLSWIGQLPVSLMLGGLAIMYVAAVLWKLR